MSGTVYELQDKQRLAVDPQDSVWLSASAGTGKTQVLSARVLRLLLEPGADPSQVLCLTFTKAGAAEMAVRVNAVLARWVRMDDAQLARELAVTSDPGALATAAYYALAAAPVQRSQPQVTIAYSSSNLIDAERFASR